MKPGNLADVTPIARGQRAGNTYLLRGFIGVFSTGIDSLGTQISKTGVNAIVFQDDQWATLAGDIREKFKRVNPEPLVLIGHSYGADDVIRIARELNKDKVAVDLLILLDPVTPPAIPANVVRCVNLYQSNGLWDGLPFLRGVPVESEKNGLTKLENLNIRTERTDLLEPGTDHFNIEKKKKIHDEVIRLVLESCPPKQQWTNRASGGGSGIGKAAGSSGAGARPAAGSY